MLDLLIAELKRSWIIYKRYPMNFASGLVIMFVTFYALVMGAQYMAGAQFQLGERLDGFILGYWMWNLTIMAFSYTATAVRMEAAAGTLEQIYLSPHGTIKIFTVRCIASIGISIGTSTIMLIILLLLLDRRLSFPPLLIVPLLTMMMASYGIGLLMSACALLFKLIGQFMTIVQFLLLPMVLVPFETWEGPAAGLYGFFPLAPSAKMLRDLMAREIVPSPGDFAVAFLNGLVIYVIGLFLFGLADRRARRRGIVGHF